jgi:hypothetical protein
MDAFPLVKLALDGDTDKLKEEIDRLVYRLVSPEDQNAVFFLTMGSLVLYGLNGSQVVTTKELILLLGQWYEELSQGIDNLPWYIRILEMSPAVISDQILYQIYIASDVNFSDIAHLLVRMDDIRAVDMLRRIDRLFPTQSLETYQSLLDLAESLPSNRNVTLYEPLLRERISQLLEPAEKPSYLIEGKVDYERLNELIASSMVTSGDLDLMIATSALSDLYLDQNRTQAINELSRLPPESLSDSAHRQSLILNRLKLGTDPELFRLFGPVNPQINDRLDIDHQCSYFGGCRMLLCTCFEGDPLEAFLDDQEEDWFTDNCKECLQPIQSRRYALREPLPVGGWKGCYCSKRCTEDAIIKNAPLVGNSDGLSQDEIYIKQEMASTLSLRLLDLIVRDLDHFGLYDEVPDINTIDPSSSYVEPPRNTFRESYEYFAGDAWFHQPDPGQQIESDEEDEDVIENSTLLAIATTNDLEPLEEQYVPGKYSISGPFAEIIDPIPPLAVDQVSGEEDEF